MNTSIPKSIINQYLKTRIKNEEEAFLHSPYVLEQRLHKAISQGDYSKAHPTLLQINSLKRAILAPHPLRSLKNSLICTCTLFTRASIQGGVQPEAAFNLSDVYIQEIEKTEDSHQLIELEYAMLAHFISTVTEEKLQSYTHSINKVMGYIHDHILQDLSLASIAKETYIHPNYLSNLFKRKVGITITDYINKKRVEESKYFLRHTESPISEISLLFRFCNQSYYTFLFKKYTGMTPKEYRNTESKTADHVM